MKKRVLFPVLLLLCLFGGTAYAETNTDSEGITPETVILTEENRYDSVYYQEPEEVYPAANSKKGRLAELSLEEYVAAALEQFQDEIDVSSYQIPKDEAAKKYFQIVNSHPSLFYVAGRIKYYTNKTTGMVTRYCIYYTDTIENIEVQQKEFNREVDRALAWTDYSSMSEAEKALAVHDYLVLECEYDYENYLNNTIPDISHTAYGVLVEKTAVCDGYALAYSCILDELGVSSMVITSRSMNHAWNLVSIGEAWYHVDATWDDPTWDSLGRVGHSFFLLSDAAISDESLENRHEGWDSYGHIADSDTYDNEFWSEVISAFCYQNGNWYYAQPNGDGTASLVKKPEVLGEQKEVVYTEDRTWNNYSRGYMYLDLEPIHNEVYFSTRTSIYKLDGNEAPVEIYTPELTENNLIFGFAIRREQVCYVLQPKPNIGSKQTVIGYKVEELRLPQITWISAQDAEAVYDGTAKQIEVEGVQAGDIVTYRCGARYEAVQPEMKDAGVYQVSYKAEREGYEDFLGSAQITIRKAQPEYAIPAGLKGSSGNTLSSVALPKGFVWEDGSAELKKEGEGTFYVSYTPEDIRNYETISHIPVKVTVSCPGHKYTEKVTKKPTAAQKGQKTYTCSICGDRYTKEIPPLTPDGTGNGESTGGSGNTGATGDDGNTQQPGGSAAPKKPGKASGLKLSKATASSLKFSWNKTKGVKYRLVLYKGNKAVSTVYTENSSRIYRKLNAAALYTLKVTPYVESGGTKIYASSDTSVKAATAPAKARLLSVKKKGSAKVKITWKKVAGADGYEVFMKTGNGSYKKIKTVTKGKTVTFTKSGLKKGKSYSFRIRAYKKAGNKKTYGSYSNIIMLKIK